MLDAVASTSHRFVARGAASPDLPLKILNLFAQQDLTIDCADIARDGDSFVISIEQRGLSTEKAAIILSKMQTMVLVESAGMHARD